MTTPATSEARAVRGPAKSGVRRYAVPVLAVLIGLTFIYAGILKAWDPVKFATDISNFRLLPWPVGVRLAFYLPWVEIICGLALLAGWFRSGAIAVFTGLTLVFIAVTVSAQMREIDLECGCFGSASKNLSFTSHMAILVGLLVALALLWAWHRPEERREGEV